MNEDFTEKQSRQSSDDKRVRQYALEKRLSANSGEKFCRGCSKTKLHSEFHKSKSHWDGVRHQRKECIKKQQNLYRTLPEIKKKVSKRRKELRFKSKMSSNQQKKIKFLEDQGGVVVDLQFTVVKKPDGSKALIDEFGRVEWFVSNKEQDRRTRHAIAEELSRLSLVDGKTDYSLAHKTAMNCRGGIES